MADATPTQGRYPYRPLPTSAQALYATGSLGSQVLVQTLTVWLFFFYTSESAGHAAPLAPIAAVGLAMTLGRFMDAITDPIIGYISDVTRSRWGRRIPYIVIGSPIMALAFVALWIPPVDGTSIWNALWLAGALQVYFLMVTIVGAPFTGIYPEIAVTQDERVAVSSWQLVFGIIGAGIALIATGPIVDVIGFPVMATIIAILGAGSRYIGLLGARGRLHYQAPEGINPFEFRTTLIPALRRLATNRNFLVLVGSLVCFNAGLLMATQAVPFYAIELLGLSAAMQAPLTAAFFITATLAIPLVIRTTRRRGARITYARSLVGATILLPLLALIGIVQGTPGLIQAIIILGIIGIPLSGIFILPEALLAQVVDDDARTSNTRREAMYFSSRSTLEKFGQTLATALFALLLALFGSTAEDPLGIHLIGPAAALLTLIGWLIFTRGYRPTAPTSPPTPPESPPSA